MRIKATLRRGDGTQDDIVITADAAATVAEIAATVARVDPAASSGELERPRTLRAQLPGQDAPVLLPGSAAIGDAWIGSGAVIAVVDQGPASFDLPQSDSPLAHVQVESGGRSRAYKLAVGSYVVGRAPSCDIVVEDPLVSARHLRIDVGESVDVVDLGSANGTFVDGGHVARLHVENAERLTAGSTTILVERAAAAALTGVTPKAGPVPFNRSPRVEVRYAGTEFESPELPKESEPPNFPFLMLLAPIVMGAGMYLMTNNPRSLLFIVMTPMMMAGNYFTQRKSGKKRLARDIARVDERLESLKVSLATERELERSVRLREAPATPLVFAEAMRLRPLLWTRRPEHWNFLTVRLGVGTMTSRNTVKTQGKGAVLPEFQERLDTLVEANRTIDGVPVVESLHDAGALGFAGPPDRVIGTLNSVLLQLTALHAPSEVVVAGLVSSVWTEPLQWLKWIPHTSSPLSPLGVHHLTDSASSAATLLGELEGLITTRLRQAKVERRGAIAKDNAAIERGSEVGSVRGPDGTKSPLPAVIVVISDDIDIERARLIQLAETGPDAGVFPLWIATDPAQLPAACRTFVSVDPQTGPRVGLVRLGEWVDDVQLEELDAAGAIQYGRRMSPVFDAGALVEDASDLPRSVAMTTLLGHELFESAEAVVDRWNQNQSINDRSGGPLVRRRPGSLRAVVGSAGADPLHLDLRSQGPHALVGGTTGSGKSEFLQAWVLGMAAEYSPDRVTFLFVDYKGGSAFADCVRLPHCVGLVTDLSPQLVIRALTSLRAELHYRERLFNRKSAKDILELERRGDPECPPALVIVIDEFAALAGEVPEFVDGVVDVAQRGRSLGIHLVMATQRPAGVIKDSLRSNTNLRVALRMADEADSQDVLGVKDAAHFDPEIPGRGAVKTGPGRLRTFQSGYAGGWTRQGPDKQATITVARLRFGGEVQWEEPVAQELPELEDLGPNDQQRLVARIVEAFAAQEIPAPRRPWLDALAPVYDLARLTQRTDAELLLGVADLPEQQSQRTMYFRPDVDGHLGVYGTGGAGKSVTLRTIAAVAGITPRGGPVYVYAVDFAAGSMRMLSALPHVGAVVRGEDTERVVGLLRMLRDELALRAESFAAVSASNVTEYRQLAGQPATPRLLLLIDGYPGFRDEFEIGHGRAEWYEVFRDILTDGRQLGIHVVFTADRAGAVPTNVRSLVQRNVLLRLSEDGHLAFNSPRDIITASSPNGRAVLDGIETQIAVIGGTTSVSDQAVATTKLGDSMRAAGVPQAPAVRTLPVSYGVDQLPVAVDGWPVLGLEDATLGPQPFDPTGTFVVAGPIASGRSNAMVVIAEAVRRTNPDARCYLLAQRRSALAVALPWKKWAVGVEDIAELARHLLAVVSDPDGIPGVVVLIEGINDYLNTPADKPIQELAKAIRNSDHLIVAEAETGSWSAMWPLTNEFKNGRRGLILQPENQDGDNIFKVSLPRGAKGEFPPGRGAYIARSRSTRVQLPLILGQE